MSPSRTHITEIDLAYENSRRYGVTENHDVSTLLDKHREILRDTLEAFLAIGRAEADLEHQQWMRDNSGNVYRSDIERREPVFSFIIDGTRGSGKTSLVRAIRYFSEVLCRRADSNIADAQNQVKTCWVRGGMPNRRTIPAGLFEPLVAGAARRRLMVALPLIRPDHMETSETIMESVFAQIAELLDREEMKEAQLSDKALKIADLRKKLHSEIAKGWYFSRRMGVEALLNDSMSFSEYIERRSSEATTSHTRITRWRRYIVEVLDVLDAQILGVFIDDTDVSSDLTVDLLHSIRMFFCHPRIITVVAGNMHTMRQRLLQDAMSRIFGASRPLRASNSFTAAFWRRFERENVEEHLEKVFPRPMRHFIRIGPKEVKKLLGESSFASFCEDEMKARLAEFLRHRIRTCLTGPDDPSHMYNSFNHDTNQIENYLALWLLKNHYVPSLTPSTARHMNYFRSIVNGSTIEAGDAASETRNGAPERRVAVALFTEPRNFELIQRFTDRDRNVIDWLKQQDVSVDWRGPRRLRINKLNLSFSSPSAELLFFRLDLEFAMPRNVRGLATYPEALLPKVSGHNIWAPEVWETRDRSRQVGYIDKLGISHLSDGVLRLRQEVLGLALSFYSPVIPANCLYMKDVRGLPDLTWRQLEAGEKTDSPPLIREWGELPIEDIDALFDLDRFDVRNSYFRDVVFMLGSFPLPPPVPTDLHRSQEFGLLDYEEMSICGTPIKGDTLSTTDIEESENFCVSFGKDRFFESARKVIAAAYRDQLESEDEKAEPLKTDRVKAEVKKRAPGNIGAQSDATKDSAVTQLFDAVMPRYHRIVCDLRRAHAALRILESDLNDYAYQCAADLNDQDGNKNGELSEATRLGERPLFSHNPSDKIRLFGLHKLRTVLGLTGISHIRRGNREPDELPEDKRYFWPDAEAHWRVISTPTKRGGRKAASFGSADIQRLVAILEGKGSKRGDERRRFHSPLLDCSSSPSGADQRRLASHMRSLLLFLWGVGPSLSSVIHLEVMGEWYWWEYDFRADTRSRGTSGPSLEEKRRKSLERVLEKWNETLVFAARFVVFFSLALETNLVRQIHAATESPKDSGTDELFTPFPDFSISTLGLRIYRHNIDERLDEKKHKSHPWFEGVVGDTLMRIQLAMWYVDELQAWVKKPDPLEASC